MGQEMAEMVDEGRLTLMKKDKCQDLNKKASDRIQLCYLVLIFSYFPCFEVTQDHTTENRWL